MKKSNKVIYVLLSVLVTYIHVYIITCIYCSRIFVWWEYFIGSPYSRFILILFFLSIFINSILIVFNVKRFIFLSNLVKYYIHAFTLLNIIFWIYVYWLFGLSPPQYLIFILIHIVFIACSIKIEKERKSYQ